MPVVFTPTKNWPSKRASRASLARSQISVLNIAYGPLVRHQYTTGAN